MPPASPNTVTRPDVDVAIVGAGPTGLVLAALLEKAGITCRVFEKRAGLHRSPQAHVINTRTMEILRELGIERTVQEMAAPPLLMQWITWCESIGGRELGRIALQADPSAMPSRLAQSPTTIANLAQNRLEPLLLDLVAGSSRAEVRFASEVVSAVSHGDHVVVHTRDARGDEQETRASFVVACDGAGSSVRRELGIEMEGPASLQKFISVYFEADLTRWIGARTGPLFWIAGARTRGVVIGFDLARTWALMVPYDEPHTPADFTDAVVDRLVRDAIGDDSADIRITSVGNWNMSAQLATRYREGRIFLAGDAAHRFPPTGGFGMNTGIQDAHNLAWKLAAVLRGHGGDALLDSYEAERRPVAATNSEQSVSNAMRLFEIDMVLGRPVVAPVDPTGDMSGPSPLVDFGLDGDGEAATTKRRDLDAVLQSQADHFDFGGLDLGFRYEAGAVVADASEAPPFDVRVYTPSARPGSRLPHVWLQRHGRRMSTLDVATPGRFTLITGNEGDAWTGAARELVRVRAVGLDIAVIARDSEAAGAYADSSGRWAALSGLEAGGALLVRPDGHIAWRHAERTDDAAYALEELGRALDILLGAGTTDVSTREVA